jgi:hypothetical protein
LLAAKRPRLHCHHHFVLVLDRQAVKARLERSTRHGEAKDGSAEVVVVVDGQSTGRHPSARAAVSDKNRRGVGATCVVVVVVVVVSGAPKC